MVNLKKGFRVRGSGFRGASSMGKSVAESPEPVAAELWVGRYPQMNSLEP
jgi:hypothetical protein